MSCELHGMETRTSKAAYSFGDREQGELKTFHTSFFAPPRLRSEKLDRLYSIIENIVHLIL